MASVSHKLGGDRRFWVSLPRLEFAGTAPAARRIALFTLAIAIVSLPGAVPTIDHSQVRVITPALAILSFAFAWLPRREAPLYALIYAASRLARVLDPVNPGFEIVETGINICEALALALLVPRYLTRQQMIAQPFRVVAYILASLFICLVGATLAIVSAAMFHLSAADYRQELAGNAALAWRYWWLGHACSLITIAGTFTFIRQSTSADRAEIFGDPRERRSFTAYTVAHAVIALTVLPLWDMSWLGLPADVRLALSFFPMMSSMLLASRFRASVAPSRSSYP